MKRKANEEANLGRSKKKPKVAEFDQSTSDRIVIAVIAMRVLAGGTTQVTHWNILNKIFRDVVDVSRHRTHFFAVARKDKDRIERLQEVFQEAFLVAYEKGEVPSIDHDKLDADNYDWSTVVEWGLKLLHDPALYEAGGIGLPAKRDTIDQEFTIQLGDRNDDQFRSMYNDVANKNMTARIEYLHSITWAAPLDEATERDSGYSSNDTESTPEKPSYATVKSIVRAVVATPSNTYNLHAAAHRLSQLPSNLIEKAETELAHVDNVFSSEHKNRFIPGRMWHLSDVFLKKFDFRYDIGRSHLHLEPLTYVEAAQWKDKLDIILQGPDATFRLPVNASDPLILLVTNLAANGRIQITNKLPPTKNEPFAAKPRISKWGFLDASYEGKKIDTQDMVWPVIVKPTLTYYLGDGEGHIFNANMLLDANILGLGSRPPHAREVPVPIWIDVHGRLIPDLFVKTMVGIIQQCALFGVTSTKELRRAFKYALETWELDLAVHYLVDFGALRKTGFDYVGIAGPASNGFHADGSGVGKPSFPFTAAEAWYVCLLRLYGLWNPLPVSGCSVMQVPRRKVRGASAITVREGEWRGGSAGVENVEGGAGGGSKGKGSQKEVGVV